MTRQDKTGTIHDKADQPEKKKTGLTPGGGVFKNSSHLHAPHHTQPHHSITPHQTHHTPSGASLEVGNMARWYLPGLGLGLGLSIGFESESGAEKDQGRG